MRLLRRRRPTTEAPPADAGQAVVLSSVRKVYGKGEGAVIALRDLSLGFDTGSFTAVMGPSGSGKSTFLHTAAGLDQPTVSSVWSRPARCTPPSQTSPAWTRRS